MYRIASLLLVTVACLGIIAAPSAQPADADVGAVAASAGFGAAFAYSQTIATVSYTATGSIGNGAAMGFAFTPVSYSWSEVFTFGNAAAMAQAIGTPFGSTASTQLVSFPGGGALGMAFAGP
jgi:hypothetical protein